jgi:hypothetical protein
MDVLRAFVFISVILTICALVAYFRGKRSAAIKWNVAIPSVAIIGTLFVMFSQPLDQESINAAALSLFAIPIAEILLCLLAMRFQKTYHLFFWLVWLVNAAIITFAIYLAFFFRIQF